MGDEARCTVRYGDRVSGGKALLETDELLFRGEFRLAIPRRAIAAATAADGTLTVRFGDELAAFELGKQAERWAQKIRSPKTLLDKLGVKPDSRVSVLDVADESFHALLRERGVRTSDGANEDADVVVFQTDSVEDLDRLRDVARSLRPNGALWIVAPKGGREPREAQVLEAGRRAGLVDVKVARFSDTHTAHKFVIPVARR